MRWYVNSLSALVLGAVVPVSLVGSAAWAQATVRRSGDSRNPADDGGGGDQVIVRGNDTPHIRLKIVGGHGDDIFVDSTRTGGVKFYDDHGHNIGEGERRVSINTKHHDEWVGSDTNRYPPRE